jgi:hypothetical protein
MVKQRRSGMNKTGVKCCRSSVNGNVIKELEKKYVIKAHGKATVKIKLYWKGEYGEGMAYKIKGRAISIDYLHCLLSGK